MKPFKDFVQNTKDDTVYILVSIIIITISSLCKSVIGNKLSRIIILLGVFLLGYSLTLYLKHIKSFYINNPNFYQDNSSIIYKKNIYASCGVCVLIVILLLYSTYTVFF